MRGVLKEHPGLAETSDFHTLVADGLARKDELELVKLAIKCGMELDTPTSSGNRVGMIQPAADGNALKVAKWLLEQGAAIHDEFEGESRCTPLDAAIRNGHLEMVKLLVEVGQANVNSTSNYCTPLTIATHGNQEPIVKYLRSQGAKTSEELGFMPITQLCELRSNGDVEGMRAALVAHPELMKLEAFRQYVVRSLAKEDKVEFMQLFVELGFDINTRLDEAGGIIEAAINLNSLDVVRWSLEHGAVICDDWPLLIPASDGRLEMVKLLVETANVDVNATTADGDNALKLALTKRRDEVAKYLRLKGAKTPEELGIGDGSSELVAHLETYLGHTKTLTLQETIPCNPPITIHRATNRDLDDMLLVTEGMSSLPMKSSDGKTHYVELVMKLPPKWPLTDKGLKKSKNFWPIDWLCRAAIYPHQKGLLWNFEYTVIANGDPPQPFDADTQLCCLLLMHDPDGTICSMERSDGTVVEFYFVVPIYAEERDLLESEGLDELETRFSDHWIDTLDPHRVNVALLGDESAE